MLQTSPHAVSIDEMRKADKNFVVRRANRGHIPLTGNLLKSDKNNSCPQVLKIAITKTLCSSFADLEQHLDAYDTELQPLLCRTMFWHIRPQEPTTNLPIHAMENPRPWSAEPRLVGLR
jgi:hypothetical protein